MNTEDQLIEALKNLLKQQKKTYKDVALWLNLSEGSVKRLFSKSDMSIERLILILKHLGRDMNDLVGVMNNDNQQISQISVSHEQELVDDIPAILTALGVLSHLQINEIAKHYDFDEAVIEQALLKLDKMQILTLLPNNHYQLNVHPNFRWLAGGPIQQFFMNNLATEFISDELGEDDDLLLLSAMLGSDSVKRLAWLVDEFTQRFQQLNTADRALPLSEKNATFIVLSKRKNWFSGTR